MQELADFKICYDAKQEAAGRRVGMNRSRGWPAPESAQREGSPRYGRSDRNRDERHHRREEDSRERHPRDQPPAGSRWDEKSGSSYSSSDSSRRDDRRRSLRRRKEKNEDRSSESASPARSTAPIQLPAPPLPRPQHLTLPTVHHPAPSDLASEKSLTLL